MSMDFVTEYTPLMKRLAALFPQRPISDATFTAYYDLLSGIDTDVFAKAILRAARQSDWFPTVKQLLAAAEDVTATIYGLRTPADAWTHVLTVARGWGEGKSVRDRFDAVTWDALQAIGGIRVVALSEDGAEIARHERLFRDAYTRGFQRNTQELMTMPLPADDRTRAIPAGGQR